MDYSPKVLLRIKALYPEFTPAYRRIADYICEHPDELLNRRVHELAAVCGCDAPQVVRFCQKVGFSGFRELGAALASEFIPTAAAGPVGENPIDAVKREWVTRNLRAVNDTAALLDTPTVANAAQLLRKAGRIVVCGFGVSGIVAHDLHTKLFRMGFPVFYSADVELARLACGLFGPDDVLIAISFSGENEEVLALVRETRKLGGNVIAISNYPASPLGKNCDILLQCAADETPVRMGAMSSRIAQLIAVDFLVLVLALEDSGSIGKNIIRTHQAIFATNAKRTRGNRKS